MSLEQNIRPAQTFRELLGLHKLTEADFPIGASFVIDQARIQQARHAFIKPDILPEGCIRFGDLLKQTVAIEPVAVPVISQDDHSQAA